MPALAANLALVRQVLAGLADGAGVDVGTTADMKIAITEACTNAVVHAYPGGHGPLEITMTALSESFLLSIRDRGTEFNPLPTDTDTAALGFGLALIASLSDEFGIRAGA